MKIEKLKQRLERQRPMTTVTVRMPEDVVADLQQVAQLLGFSSHESLIRAYVGQGLRVDLERWSVDAMSALVESLKRRGVSDAVIREALDEVAQR